MTIKCCIKSTVKMGIMDHELSKMLYVSSELYFVFGLDLKSYCRCKNDQSDDLRIAMKTLGGLVENRESTNFM